MNSNNYRSIFIGGIHLVAPLLKTLLKHDFGLKAVFCPNKNYCSNSDYLDLTTIVEEDVPCHIYDDVNSVENISLIASYKPTVIYAIGISQIINKQILNIPSFGVLGGHISMLPENRGCSPLIWTIANGLTESALSLIWLDKGIDSGKIAEQRKFTIEEHENAFDIYSKVSLLYSSIFEHSLLPKFHKSIFPATPQEFSNISNRWRKRSFKDGVIDWRMSAKRIHNLIRALHHPYPGASFFHNNVEYKVWNSEIKKANEKFEPGKILDINISRNVVTIKAGDNALCLLKHNLDLNTLKINSYLIDL